MHTVLQLAFLKKETQLWADLFLFREKAENRKKSFFALRFKTTNGFFFLEQMYVAADWYI